MTDSLGKILNFSQYLQLNICLLGIRKFLGKSFLESYTIFYPGLIFENPR